MIPLEADVTFEERFCFKLFLCGGVQNQCKSSLVRLKLRSSLLYSQRTLSRTSDF